MVVEGDKDFTLGLYSKSIHVYRLLRMEGFGSRDKSVGYGCSTWTEDLTR